MSERLDHTRVFDLQRLNDWLHGFLMMFAPAQTDCEVDAVEDIAWEDGEIEDQTDSPTR